MGGHDRADVVLLDVARVRDERLHPVAAGQRHEDLGRRAEVDEPLDRGGDAVLALGGRRLDPDALRADREPDDTSTSLALGRARA